MEDSKQTLAIIKAGSTFPALKQHLGDFEGWVINGCGALHADFTVFDLAKNPELPDIDKLSGLIITGSHAMVTDLEPWVQNLIAWIPQVVDRQIPMLGICFGHQLLAQAMGGLVAYHPEGREIGSVCITLTEDGKQDYLLGRLPEEFKAHTTHAQTVLRLPIAAKVLAKNTFEAHHAFRIGKNSWGVQFHPEFTADIMNEYIVEQANSLTISGYDVKKLQDSICNTQEANGLLKRFWEITQKNHN